MLDEQLLNEIIEYNKKRKFDKDLELNEKKYHSIVNARYNKCSRIKRRLAYLLNHRQYIWFITFTFDDEYIDKCDRTKKDLIKSCLNTSDFMYILNVDYGSKKEREHYHCILGTNLNFDLDSILKSCYPCFVYAELCRTSDNDLKRLTKYINKLANHCIKDSTKNKRIYFSFKLPYYKQDAYTQRIRYYRELALLDKANTTGKIVDKKIHI